MSETLSGKLLLVRHAESEWNALGKWTGRTDVDLDDVGFKEAAQFGRTLHELGILVDAAYCSGQIRTRETLECMLDAAQQWDVPVTVSPAINERDYGEYTGKNKWEMKDILGEEKFNDIRRGWDVPIPGGETLKTVYERAVPFYIDTIVPQLAQGQNILVVAHGNTIRALKKYIEGISDEGIAEVEMPFGQIAIYTVTPDGHKVQESGVTVAVTPPRA